MKIYTEATGRKFISKEIPISQIKIDESELDQQLLQKMIAFENIKNSLQRDVSRFCSLTLRYLDSLCMLDFNKLDSEEKEHAIDIIDLVINNTQNMLQGLVLSEENLDAVIESIKDVAKFSLTCIDNTDIPVLMPLCENTVNLLNYSYVIGAYIGELNKFSNKDKKHIKEYSKFLINKNIEIKAKN